MLIFRCNSKTCSDNGGGCVIMVDDMFDAPEICPYASAWRGIEEECDCEWVEI